MPRLSGYRSTPPDLAERKLEQLDAGFRQSIRGRDNRTFGERVNGRDFGFYPISPRRLGIGRSDWLHLAFLPRLIAHCQSQDSRRAPACSVTCRKLPSWL